MKKDNMFYFLLGFMSYMLISIIIVWQNPTPEATWCDKMDEVCANCGMKAWYFKDAGDIAHE